MISPDDEEWDIVNTQGETTLSLKAVLEYKYLGIKMFGSMFKTGKVKQEQAVQSRAGRVQIQSSWPGPAGRT